MNANLHLLGGCDSIIMSDPITIEIVADPIATQPQLIDTICENNQHNHAYILTMT